MDCDDVMGVMMMYLDVNEFINVKNIYNLKISFDTYFANNDDGFDIDAFLYSMIHSDNKFNDDDISGIVISSLDNNGYYSSRSFSSACSLRNIKLITAMYSVTKTYIMDYGNLYILYECVEKCVKDDDFYIFCHLLDIIDSDDTTMTYDMIEFIIYCCKTGNNIKYLSHIMNHEKYRMSGIHRIYASIEIDACEFISFYYSESGQEMPREYIEMARTHNSTNIIQYITNVYYLTASAEQRELITHILC